MTAVDFSFARPTVAELHAAGVNVVLRYINGAGKAITKDELASYLEAVPPIAVVFVFEVGTDDVAGGAAAGTQHAREFLAALAALEITDNTVALYFAVDESIDPHSAIPYFQGINAVIPWTRTGDYGQGTLLLLMQQLGLAARHWLSESTGFPGYQAALNSGIVGIQQSTAHPAIADTDVDYLRMADVGQFPRPPAPAPVPPTPAPAPPVPKPTTQEVGASAWGTPDFSSLCGGVPIPPAPPGPPAPPTPAEAPWVIGAVIF